MTVNNVAAPETEVEETEDVDAAFSEEELDWFAFADQFGLPPPLMVLENCSTDVPEDDTIHGATRAIRCTVHPTLASTDGGGHTAV